MLRELPIFGVCGHSGSGKTTLIEALIPRLAARGLSVAVAKFHAHGIQVDRDGKDSDRFFRAGADVWLEGPDQGFGRTHPVSQEQNVRRLVDFARRYDVVLLEGRKQIDCWKVWLLGEDETSAPDDLGEVITTLGRDADRVEAVWKILDDWLPRQWLRTPVLGCVLIGGASTRMGRPKHLIETGGRSWIEHACSVMGEVSDRVMVAGAGDLPTGLTEVVRLPDVTDATGPVSGILSVMRWAPGVSWLVSACDLPNVSTDALRWLLSTRAPGVWATIPKLRGRDHVEPLLAHYDFRARALIEQMLTVGRRGPSHLARCDKVITPAPPDEIAPAWENVNTPDDLSRTRWREG